jgi:SAM-dependent methyltransferase
LKSRLIGREWFGKLTLFNDRHIMKKERDYVLGTHQEEIERLGLQHRVWQPVVLDCWQRAGITVGKHVLDLGAGPGYAAVDLSEIVGPNGTVAAVERSNKFVDAMKGAIHLRSLTNVKVHELDLISDELPNGPYDFAWCRWVLAFVSDPAVVIKKLATVLPKGACAIFHEYGHYETWRFLPRLESQELFRGHVIATWRESGGEPDAAPILPALLGKNGFIIRSARTHIFCVRPNEFMWQWPATFIEVYLPRLLEQGRIDRVFADQVRTDLAAAEKNPNALMITPLVVEIVAEKIA